MFEFDVNKSKSNLEKHGIDFEEAQKLWLDDKRVELPADSSKELRFMVVGQVGEKVWSAIVKIVDENIRIISVRRARKNEKEIYYSGGTGQGL